MFTRDYAKAMLRGDKGLLKLSEVKFIQVVRYDELAVKHLYKDFLAMPNMSYYFPDRYPKGRCCDRDYMFNVANTLHEEVVKEVVQHALKQRYAVDSMTVRDESVLINDHWAQEIKSLPIISHVSTRHDANNYSADPYSRNRKKAGW